jgi:hypothetical protein
MSLAARRFHHDRSALSRGIVNEQTESTEDCGDCSRSGLVRAGGGCLEKGASTGTGGDRE